MADEVSDLVAQALADQVEQQNAAEEETRKQQTEVNSQITDVRNALLQKLTQGKEPKVEIPADVQEVIQILMAQPRFVEPTKKFLLTLVARVNAAVNEIINDVLDTPTS